MICHDIVALNNLLQCSPGDIFNPSLELDGFKIETWVPFAATALQSLLYGAAGALDEACGSRDALCDNFRRNPEILVSPFHLSKLKYCYMNIFDE